MQQQLLVIGGTDFALDNPDDAVAARINRPLHGLRRAQHEWGHNAGRTNGAPTPALQAAYYAPHGDRSSAPVVTSASDATLIGAGPFAVYPLHGPRVPIPALPPRDADPDSGSNDVVDLPYPMLWQRQEIDQQIRRTMQASRGSNGCRLVVHAHTAGPLGCTLRNIASQRSLPLIATHHAEYAPYFEHHVKALIDRLRIDPRLALTEITQTGGVLADLFPDLLADAEWTARVRSLIDQVQASHDHLVVHREEGSRRVGALVLTVAQLVSQYAHHRVRGARALLGVISDLNELLGIALTNQSTSANGTPQPSWISMERIALHATRAIVHAYLRWFYSACELVIVADAEQASILSCEAGVAEERIRIAPPRADDWPADFYRANVQVLQFHDRQIRRPRLKRLDEHRLARGSHGLELEPFIALSDAHFGDEDPIQRAMALDALFEVASKLGVSRIRYVGDFGDLSAQPNKIVSHRNMFNRVRARWVDAVDESTLPETLHANVDLPDLDAVSEMQRAAITRQLKKASMRVGLEVRLNGAALDSMVSAGPAAAPRRTPFEELFITGNHDEGVDPAVLLPGCEVAPDLAHFDYAAGAVITHGHILGLPEFFAAIQSGKSPQEIIGALQHSALGESLEYASVFHDFATTLWRRSEQYVNVRHLWKHTLQPPVSGLVRWLRSARVEGQRSSHPDDRRDDAFAHFVESTISPADDVQAAAQFAAAIHDASNPCWISVYGHSHKDDLQKVTVTNPATGNECTTIVANCGKFHGKPITCLVASFPKAVIARWSKKDQAWRIHKRVRLTDEEVDQLLNARKVESNGHAKPVVPRRNGKPSNGNSVPDIICEVPTEGDGHISRFTALYPYYKQIGSVCTVVSGPRAADVDLPGGVAHRCAGFALQYNAQGGVHRWRSAQDALLRIPRLWREARDLSTRIHEFRHVITDFGPTLTYAHRRARKLARKADRESSLPPLVNVSHQAALESQQTNVPRPTERMCGASNIALGQRAIDALRGDRSVGFHYERYNDGILPPLIRPDLVDAEAAFDGDFVLVYVRGALHQLAEVLESADLSVGWRIYTHQVPEETRLAKSVWAFPRDRRGFRDDMLHCLGLVADCGFGLSSEALHLGIPFVGRPLPNHYEQQCNAAALSDISHVGLVQEMSAPDTKRVLRESFGAFHRDRRRLTRTGRAGRILPYRGVAAEAAATIFDHANA